MGKKIRYEVTYRSEAAPKGSLITTIVEAESESKAIQQVRKQHPKATDFAAKPK